MIINSLNITVNFQGTVPTNRRYASVSLTPNSGSDSISLLGQFKKVGGDGDLVIAGATVAGTIGDATNGGLVEGCRIGAIESHGDIYADMVLVPAAWSSPAAEIVKVESMQGSIRGDIDASQGRLLEALAVEGNIGAAGAGGAISILSSGDVDLVDAGEIFASINTRANSGNGSLIRLRTSVGDFVGNVDTVIIGARGNGHSGMYITGDLDADLMLSGNLWGKLDVDGDFVSNRTVKIRAGIQSGAPITIDGEFSGQVILNAQNGTQAWVSNVTVNGELLSPTPAYAQTSAELGGGAVGMAPFRLHKEDCDPPHNFAVSNPLLATLLQSDFEDDEVHVVIRHYGPIKLPGSETNWTNAVIVEVGDPDSNTWMRMDGMFDVVAHPDGNSRAIGLKRHESMIPAVGVYRVSPFGDEYGIVCDEVDGEPEVEWTGGYYIFRVAPNCDAHIGAGDNTNDYVQIDNDPDLDIDPEDGILDICQGHPPCSADFNKNGMVEIADIFDMLGAWFAHCDESSSSISPPCYGRSANWNNNYTGDPPEPYFDVADIFAFLATWFSGNGGCGTCCVGDVCTLTTSGDCAGTWALGGSCNPNPCD